MWDRFANVRQVLLGLSVAVMTGWKPVPRSIAICLLAWLGSMTLARPMPADTPGAVAVDEQFVAGLLERRLFTLAELECQRQLAGADLSPRTRATWTVELIRIRALHATNSAPQQRGALWQAAHQAAGEFLSPHAENPRRVLVELQDALTYLAEGELARLEADVAVEPQDALVRARDMIREAAQAPGSRRQNADRDAGCRGSSSG